MQRVRNTLFVGLLSKCIIDEVEVCFLLENCAHVSNILLECGGLKTLVHILGLVFEALVHLRQLEVDLVDVCLLQQDT